MGNLRKKRFVDPAVQGAILLRLIMNWFLFLITAGAFLYFIELLGGNPQDAGRNVVSRHSPTVLAVLALAPIFLWDLCKLTHRFAGPIVRLRRAMRELAEGRDMKPIRFREGDFWQDLATDFNRVLEQVKASRAEALREQGATCFSQTEREVTHV